VFCAGGVVGVAEVKYDPDTDEMIIECSGARVYAHCGIVGLGPDPYDASEGLRALQGYDGDFDSAKLIGFNAAEKREIADHMVALWLKWAQQ
jgi:hypothetical protein